MNAMMTDMPWSDFKDRVSERLVAVLPVGSVEQHGLHAPLGTDLFIAQGLSATVRSIDEAMLLPPVPVGVAEYHRDFAGSLWVRPETLKAYVGEIIASLADYGVRKIVIVNGHGGNREPLKEMVRYLTLERPDLHIVVWTWFESIEPDIVAMYGRRPPLHADETETAMLTAIRPDTVLADRYAASAEGAGEWGQFYKGTMVSQRVRDFSPTGATGNPALTDPELGKRMFELSRDNLRDLIGYMSAL